MMHALIVEASSEGFRDPTTNDTRTTALLAELERMSKQVRLVIVPAGYWMARNENGVRALANKIASKLSPVLIERRCALIGGIDAEPLPATKPGTEVLIRTAKLPFFGFAVLEDGQVTGPWRQVSTTGDNYNCAPPKAADRIRDRLLSIDGVAVLPLVCGEMHNENVRSLVGSTGATLVTVSGHKSLGSGLKPSLAAVRHRSAAADRDRMPVLHAQHLVPHSGGSVHWVDRTGKPNKKAVQTPGAGFWLFAHEVAIDTAKARRR
jgi:hypothetical protein